MSPPELWARVFVSCIERGKTEEEAETLADRATVKYHAKDFVERYSAEAWRILVAALVEQGVQFSVSDVPTLRKVDALPVGSRCIVVSAEYEEHEYVFRRPDASVSDDGDYCVRTATGVWHRDRKVL